MHHEGNSEQAVEGKAARGQALVGDGSSFLGAVLMP
jgi:hypothetical protein